ncbi:MAG: Lrp/AsnC family transcriptional regulator [Nanoarchaeota archaeon]|nr:Lrp/AsnC family transcriptional regulator [Nanoarchaeota archaeon]MBU1029641.1 Lrp/AsnC family transcriptional regulator [Nanoarchaeota archaeon]
MNLTKTDIKLFSYIYHHGRESYTKIAKACSLSRAQVEYGIKKLEKNGIIKKYVTMFNYKLLGYNHFVVVWMRVKKNKDMIKKVLEAMKNVISVGDILIHYDVFANFIVKDIQEFENIFYSFLEEYKDDLLEYYIFPTTYIGFFPLKVFGILKKKKDYEIIGKEDSRVELNDKDFSILKELEKNARVPIIDIAKKTSISSELIVYKLKQFYKQKLVLGTRIQFDSEKIGFYAGLVVMKIDKNEELIKKIKTFCRCHKHVNALALGISDFNCFIQIFYQKDSELRQTIRDIDENFKEAIKKTKVIFLENEGRVKTLPY